MVIYWIASDQLIAECNEINNRYDLMRNLL